MQLKKSIIQVLKHKFFISTLLISASIYLFLQPETNASYKDEPLSYAQYTRSTGVNKYPTITLTVPKNHLWSDDFLGRLHHEEKTHSLFFNTVANLDQKRYLIIDAGAHVGDTAVWIAQFAKKAKKNIKVLAVDPDQSKIDFINDLAVKNNLQNHIITVTAAVSDDFAKVSIVKTQNKKKRKERTLHPGAWKVKETETGQVDMLPLDHIYHQLQLEEYATAILHLDVEGYEFKAMQGAISLIVKDHPLCVFEMLHTPSTTRIREVMKFLGFSSDQRLHEENENEVFYKQNKKNHQSTLKLLGQMA